MTQPLLRFNGARKKLVHKTCHTYEYDSRILPCDRGPDHTLTRFSEQKLLIDSGICESQAEV